MNKEKTHKLFRIKDYLEEPCYLEVIEYPNGSLAFVGDEYGERFVYAYPKQVKQIKKIVDKAIENQGGKKKE